MRLWPCQVGNTGLGSSWGGLTALSSPSLKIHLKAVAITNCGIKKGKRKEQGRLCQHWKAVVGGSTLLPGESHGARGMQQLFFFKEEKKINQPTVLLPNVSLQPQISPVVHINMLSSPQEMLLPEPSFSAKQRASDSLQIKGSRKGYFH